jgi:sulfatase modifying factor 1
MNYGDALAFCNWLSHKENRSYRLPTEAEWEFACRAGTVTRTPYGSTVSARQAVTLRGDIGRAEPVGSRAANAFGLHDMIGNVWEWCSDFDGPYLATALTDPTGPKTGKKRVVRGFSFENDIIFGAAYRLTHGPNWFTASHGFRVACDLGPPPSG